MFPKLIIVVFITGLLVTFDQRSLAVPFFVVALGVVVAIESIRQVPQQMAWVVERLGKFHSVLEPGLNVIVPFLDRVAYRHSLKETPLDVPEQVCITRDNTQLGVDGIIYYQVTDPELASYGSSDYISAVTQLAQTTLRSEIGKMELDKTFESRDVINRQVVAVLDEAGRTWGVKVLRYEIKNLTPPDAILRAMQAQITAEREKRALIAKSEGQRQEEINLADGEKQAAVLKSEGDKTAAINSASPWRCGGSMNWISAPVRPGKSRPAKAIILSLPGRLSGGSGRACVLTSATPSTRLAARLICAARFGSHQTW